MPPLGEAIGALSLSIPLAQKVAETEALACRRAVQFTGEIGLHRVIFEGDAAVVINAISQGNDALSAYGNIINDIRCLVAVFQVFQFCHVHCN